MHKTASQCNILKKTIPIVYEDKTICIVNKPYGLPIQGGAQISVCLIDILSKQLGLEIFPVHRLDKETAGLLVTAKNVSAARLCRSLFDSQAVKKEYIAFCFGGHKASIQKQHINEDIIDMPIMEHGIAKQALSSYRLLTYSENYSLFSIRPHTGRMHQLRIHLAGIGHPIIGDDKHGNFALNKQLWKIAHVKKLQLCAYRLRFPINGSECLFTVPIPDHMRIAIETLLRIKLQDTFST